MLFTAHSLPERVLVDDPYPDQLRAVGRRRRRARRAGPLGRLGAGWQSAGRTPEPWRGPDILEVIRDLAATGRADGVLVCPQGFVSDHLEVLYDLDIEARRVAAEAGLAFARTASLNDDPAVMAALADRVRRAVAAPAAPGPVVRPGDPEVDLVVVGGGITGLAAAWEGLRQGADVVVLEAGDEPGGKLRTSPFAGSALDEARRRLPGPGARGGRAVRRARPRRRAGLARHGHGLRVERRGAAPPAGGAGARRAHRPRRAGGVGSPVRRGRRAGACRPHRARRPTRRRREPSGRSSGAGSATRCSTGWWRRSWAGSTRATATACRCRSLPPTWRGPRRDRDPSLVRGAAAVRAEAAEQGAADRPVFLAPRGGVARLVDALAERLGDACGVAPP